MSRGGESWGLASSRLKRDERSEARRTALLRPFVFPALVLLAAALLLLCRLDDAYLWQDEAETAIVSRHWLAYGLPLSTDGSDWVQQAGQSFVEFTSDYVWIYHSWLQYALTAASFAILGPTTFAARLPFVLVGLATFCLFYVFMLRWLGDRRTVRVAMALLLFCVPFLLLLRQCRYYALAALFTLLTLDAYFRLRSGDLRCGWALPYFVLSAVLLYHSHYGAFFPTIVALALHCLVRRPRAGALRRLLVGLSLAAVLVLPWAVFMRVLNRGQPFQLDRFLAQLGQYFVYTTAWIFPLTFVLVLPVVWVIKSTETRPSHTQAQALFCQVAGLVILVNVLTLSFSAAFDWVFFRYMAHLIPLLLAMLAIVIVRLMERWAVAGYALLLALVTSNALHTLPYGLPGLRGLHLENLWPRSGAFVSLDEVWSKAGRFRSEVWMYAQELTHSYEGPNEGLAAYLAAHARPGETVAVNYEELPLMFYTRLHVVGGLSAHGLDDNPRPDWVIDRKYGPYRDRLEAIVAAGSYERIEIPYPDIRWENRPEPGSHQYLTVRDEGNVVLYRRREE